MVRGRPAMQGEDHVQCTRTSTSTPYHVKHGDLDITSTISMGQHPSHGVRCVGGTGVMLR